MGVRRRNKSNSSDIEVHVLVFFRARLRECNRHSDTKQNAKNKMQNRRQDVIRHAVSTLNIEKP